jgi:DNA-directed RNA polymerase specialized sigma24 family protein
MTLVQSTAPLEAVEAFPALAELYRAHAPRLRGLARLLVADTGVADELVQDAFIGLQRNAGRLRDVGAAPAYLRSSVVNSARSWVSPPGPEPRSVASRPDASPGSEQWQYDGAFVAVSA